MGEFATERLHLAIFLHATGALVLKRCGLAANRKVTFIFEDPKGIGCEQELAFDRGAMARGTDIFASQKFIRRKMSELTENRRIEKSNEYCQSTTT